MKKQEAIRTVVAALYNVSDEVAYRLNPHPLIWNNHNALIGALKHGLISMGQCTQQEWDSAWGDEDKCQAIGYALNEFTPKQQPQLTTEQLEQIIEVVRTFLEDI